MSLFNSFLLALFSGSIMAVIFFVVSAWISMRIERKYPQTFNFTTGSIPPGTTIIISFILAVVGFAFGFSLSW